LNAIFWDVAPCGFIVNRRYRLTLFLADVISSALKMEATRTSETSVYYKLTWQHIPKMEFFIVTAVKTSNPA
jgi:hypothetical protein